MEDGHVVVVGQPIPLGLHGITTGQFPRVASRLEQHDRASRFGEARSQGPAAGARAHDDVLAVGLPVGPRTHAPAAVAR